MGGGNAFRLKDGEEHVSKKVDDSHQEVCSDNVWVTNMFKLRVFSFEDAVKAHRETHHPSMYNQPGGPIHAYIELDMSTDKKVSVKCFSNSTRVELKSHRLRSLFVISYSLFTDEILRRFHERRSR